jgi:hypothetical protein
MKEFAFDVEKDRAHGQYLKDQNHVDSLTPRGAFYFGFVEGRKWQFNQCHKGGSHASEHDSSKLLASLQIAIEALREIEPLSKLKHSGIEASAIARKALAQIEKGEGLKDSCMTCERYREALEFYASRAEGKNYAARVLDGDELFEQDGGEG